MLRLLLVLTAFVISSIAMALPDPGRLLSPEIKGDVLYLNGRVDSHFYDYLSREARAMKNVKVVELNSYGGSHSWGLDTAAKLKQMNLTTRVSPGAVCASACVYLFAAGQVREMAAGTWLGIHGARMGPRYTTMFDGLCMIQLEDGRIFEPRLRGCAEFLKEWDAIVRRETLRAFRFLESNGVFLTLSETYFAMPDDEKWYENYNVLKKPDWVVTPEEALRHNLATVVLAP